MKNKKNTNKNSVNKMKKIFKNRKMIIIIAIILVVIIVTSISIKTIYDNQVKNNNYEASQENTKSNLLAGFIKKGTKFGGITGTYDALDTSDATAKPEDIAKGKTAYVNGVKITGTKEVPVVIDGVTIPEGFYYAGGSKDTGLVISDNESDEKEYNEINKNADVSTDLQGNQFVWVPVPDPSKLFANETVKLNGVTTKTDVYSKLTIRSGDSHTPVAPGDATGTKEPDVLTSFDRDEEYYKNKLGFNSTKEMADSFVTEYKAMSESIKKYKGFYIGRYEITGNEWTPTEKKGKSLTFRDWYMLYKICQNVIKNNEKVKSTMIYGVQWDATMEWLKQTKFKGDEGKVDSNSSSWGNYNNTTGSKIDTGSNPAYQANKIFDLAGNCYDWTQEAYSTSNRVIRRW